MSTSGYSPYSGGDYHQRNYQRAVNRGRGATTPGLPQPTPPIGPPGQAPAPTTPPIDQNAFYDAAVARRGRGLEAMAGAQRTAGLQGLESRGLGQSAGVNSLFGSINRNESQGYAQAQSDVYGQQFQQQEARGAEDRAYQRQKETADMDFQRQIALLKYQKKLQGGGGIWGKIAGVAGTILGGPIGGAIGGWLGSKVGGGGGNYDPSRDIYGSVYGQQNSGNGVFR